MRAAFASAVACLMACASPAHADALADAFEVCDIWMRSSDPRAMPAAFGDETWTWCEDNRDWRQWACGVLRQSSESHEIVSINVWAAQARYPDAIISTCKVIVDKNYPAAEAAAQSGLAQLEAAGYSTEERAGSSASRASWSKIEGLSLSSGAANWHQKQTGNADVPVQWRLEAQFEHIELGAN